jgi:hypothetical protein
MGKVRGRIICGGDGEKIRKFQCGKKEVDEKTFSLVLRLNRYSDRKGKGGG